MVYFGAVLQGRYPVTYTVHFKVTLKKAGQLVLWQDMGWEDKSCGNPCWCVDLAMYRCGARCP